MKRLLTTKNVFLTVLFLGLFAMAARNVTDPDVWWHLKTGQYIAQHKSVPRTDPFSFTRAGKPWIAHEWLTDLLLYEVQRTAGWGGLIVIFSAALAAAFFLLYLRCGTSPYIAGAATLCAALATIPVWGVRPQVLTFLLASLWLLILERSEHSPRLLWWTLPLMLLWVNLHAGFALGLALLGLFILGESTERVFTPAQVASSRLRSEALIFLLDLLIVPINPNGFKLFSYPIETLRSTAMQSYIAEWASPNFHHAEYWPFLLVVLATFALLAWSRSGVRPRDLLLLLVSLFAGLGAIRMIPLFVLIAIPLLCKLIRHRAGTLPRINSRAPSADRPLVNGAIVVAMAVFAVVNVFRVIERQPQSEMQHFPVGAVAFLQAHPAPGPIFNHYDWGGYLIWRLYPSTRVFIDGRADLYGQELLDQFAGTYQLKGAWRKTLENWDITAVVIPRDSALAGGLRIAPGWRVSYEDDRAVILNKALSKVLSTAQTTAPEH